LFLLSQELVPFRSPQTLLVQDPQWGAPRLLQLPDNYNILFQYYHRKACSACQKVPKDPALCLVCGTFVCLKGPCCKQQGTCECVLVRAPPPPPPPPYLPVVRGAKGREGNLAAPEIPFASGGNTSKDVFPPEAKGNSGAASG
jgi:hypothetical protein